MKYSLCLLMFAMQVFTAVAQTGDYLYIAARVDSCYEQGGGCLQVHYTDAKITHKKVGGLPLLLISNYDIKDKQLFTINKITKVRVSGRNFTLVKYNLTPDSIVFDYSMGYELDTLFTGPYNYWLDNGHLYIDVLEEDIVMKFDIFKPVAADEIKRKYWLLKSKG